MESEFNAGEMREKMDSFGPVTLRVIGDVGWITIDNPPVNATSTAVRAGLMQAVERVQSARVAVVSCAGKTFVAGGDMAEFDRPPQEPHLPDVYQAIEDSGTPFLAAMHGNVLGGGFELAMACTWRVAVAGTRFGLPEVNVGLVPGAGGSQRLPRLIGLPAAVDIACRGKVLDAADLAALGGLDRVIEGDLAAGVREFIATLPARPIAVSKRNSPVLDTDFVESARADLEKRAKGAQAPLHNLRALQWSALPFAEGQPRERALHLELRQSAESKALRHAFFAERAVARPRALDGAEPRPVSHVAVVGGGLMGAGIAAACLLAGIRVTMLETGDTAAADGRGRVEKILNGAVARGKISQATCDDYRAAFSATSDYDAAQGCDLAIEAVFEDLEVKRAVFARLASILPGDAILATNTSYLDPVRIFEGIARPERCIGLHFFSPAHVMRLLEIVRTPATSTQTLATGFALARQLRKVGVLSGICDGFIGNRMLAAYRRQADFLLADGALPHQVDAAMRNFGMPMGPYELQDLTGLQIAWANRKRQAATRDPAERYVAIADRLCELERFGQRSGKGWYRYDEGPRRPVRDPEVEALIIDYSREKGIERQVFSEAQIAERLLAVLVNEGALIVEQGIAENDAAVDMVQIHGYGFPRWRGGPMHHGEQQGWDVIAHAMKSVILQSANTWTLSKRLS